ncbi:VRR-NUC domain-containing protein [Vibrio brasiliensis]
MSEIVELEPDYYLSNFRKLTLHAIEWYPDLLSKTEHAWITAFEQLEKDAQCLLVRLLSRKGEWFRSDKLQYLEINSIPAALDALHQQGFITLNAKLDEAELARQLLTKAEIVALFSVSSRTLRKEQMLNELSSDDFTRFEQLPFTVIKLLQPAVIDLLLALFFANTRQDLSQFVLDDLGLHRFENYSLSKTRRFFSDRHQLDHLLALSRLHQCYSESNNRDLEHLTKLLQQIPDPIAHSYIERKRQHLINDLARDCERIGQLTDAIFWFKRSGLPPSRERQARIYDRLDQTQAMSDVVTEILSSPYDICELEIGHKLAQRIKRKRGERVTRPQKPQVIEHHLQLDLSTQGVELAVKSHFEQLGYHVFYAENAVLTGLFGLAFWEVIFAPIEGAFINPYQDRPLDLYHADFVTKRHSQIEAVLEQIAQFGLSHLRECYQLKHGVSNPFVYWHSFDLPLLNKCIESMPNEMIVGLFNVLLSDLKIYRSGMPDLILFKDGHFEWVEVKGPGDKLQDNQWRWFYQFTRLNVPFSVAYVTVI